MSELGIISDTHNLIRPEALAALAGCALIVHAGDVGAAVILEALGQVAPVHAIRGNTDFEPPAAELPPVRITEFEGLRILTLHDLAHLEGNPADQGVDVVVSGHTHVPRVERRGGVLYLNPGSAGPRRFRLPITVARLAVVGKVPEARIIEIVPTPRAPGPGKGGDAPAKRR